MKPNRAGLLDAVLSLGVLAFMLILLPLLTGCNELKDWRDSQIKMSHDMVNAGKLIPPDPPISIPSKITNQLPWHPEFVAMNFTAEHGDVFITALSPDDTLKTCKWMFKACKGIA